MKSAFLCVVAIVTFQCAFGFQADSLETALAGAQGEAKVKILNELFRSNINSDPVKAIGYTREALQLATEVNDQKGMAASYNNIGVAYRNQGALDLSLENYMKSLDIYSKLQNAEGVATTKNNIANIYSMKRNYGQALKFFEESSNGFVALGNTERIIGSMNNLGNLHSDLQLYDQALKYYGDAWKMGESSGHRNADPLSNIGNIYYRQGNYQRAVENYLRALEIVREQNNRIGELSILANLGEVFTKASQPAEAQKYLDQALAIAVELQASYYTPQILKSMASNYYRQGKLKEAYETMMKYDEAREKVYGEESSRKIAQMEVALSLKAQEQKIDDLELDSKIKTLRLRNTQIVITAVILTIVVGLALANIFVLRKKFKK